MRTLPLRLAPVEGESLPGYVARYSHTYQFPPGDVLRALGLDSGSGTALAAGRYGAWLSRCQIERVAIATGIDPAMIERMLLWRYAGRAFQQPTGALGAPLAAAAHGGEVLIRCSRFCADCLHERGAWLLGWQLRWSFACAAHRVLLLRRCPACAALPVSRLRERWPSDHDGPLSDPTRCVHRSRRGLCRGALSHAARSPVNEPALAAQRRINHLLDDEGPNPTLAGVGLDPASYLRDLSKLCNLVHRCSPLSPRQCCPSWSGHRVRDHPADLAAVLPTALALADLPDPVTLGDALRKLAHDRYHNDGVTLVFFDTGPMSEPLKLALRHAITQAIWVSASWQLGLRPGAHSRPVDLDKRLGPQHVPQLFWAEDYHREIADLLGIEDSNDLHGRRFCSMLLTRMLSPMDWDAAASYLDLPDPFTDHAYNRTFAKLRSTDRFIELADCVKRIANRHTQRGLIDYKQRHARASPGSNYVSHGELP